jgi:aldose 1-epimerase
VADGLIGIGNAAIQVELHPAVGARLHRIRAFGQDLLRTPRDPDEHIRDPFAWGAYVMAPWCNRMASSPTEVAGQLVNMPSNFPDGSAIHGQVYDAAWHRRPDGLLSIRGGGDGWPWRYETTLRVTVHGSAVLIRQSLTNLADTPMPGGLGLHPWFRRPLEVRLPASTVLRSNLDPAAIVEPVSDRWDLREMQPIPNDLDGSWGTPGHGSVELRWPEVGLRAAMRARSDAGMWIAIASPAAFDAVAIEPETHLPQGLRRYLNREPGRLHPMAPGATITVTTELAFHEER